jgi:hypothetical protein
VALEAVTAVLVIVLALSTLAVAYIGVLGLIGAVRLARCEGCHKLVVLKAAGSPGPCPFCRHERLLHPFHGMRHQAG